MTACSTWQCKGPATRWMTCEGEGEYAYCDDCADVLRPHEDDLGAVLAPDAVTTRDRYLRYVNRLDGAINHHQAAHQSGRFFTDLPDEALWKARDKILTDMHEGKG